jgi:hypothetical protein
MDLDQSSMVRWQWQQVFMGPTVGWQPYPVQNLLPVASAGTYVLDPAVNLVEVAVAGAVTITLPSCSNPGVPAGAIHHRRHWRLRGEQPDHHSAEQCRRDGHGPDVDQDRDGLWRLHAAARTESEDVDQHFAVNIISEAFVVEA